MATSILELGNNLDRTYAAELTRVNVDNDPSVFGASARYAIASNFTGFLGRQISQVFESEEDKLSIDELKEIGLTSETSLSRTQAIYHLRLKELGEQLSVAQRDKTPIVGGTQAVLGALAGGLLDPAAIAVSVISAGVLGVGLKALQANKLIQVLRSGSKAAKYGARAGTFGTLDGAVNVGVGKAISSDDPNQDYDVFQAATDFAVGAVFGTIAAPIGLGKADTNTKLNIKVKQKTKIITFDNLRDNIEHIKQGRIKIFRDRISYLKAPLEERIAFARAVLDTDDNAVAIEILDEIAKSKDTSLFNSLVDPQYNELMNALQTMNLLDIDYAAKARVVLDDVEQNGHSPQRLSINYKKRN